MFAIPVATVRRRLDDRSRLAFENTSRLRIPSGIHRAGNPIDSISATALRTSSAGKASSAKGQAPPLPRAARTRSRSLARLIPRARYQTVDGLPPGSLVGLHRYLLQVDGHLGLLLARRRMAFDVELRQPSQPLRQVPVGVAQKPHAPRHP